MTIWILGVLACTPTPEPSDALDALAGCFRYETRRGEGEPSPWLISESWWDERGRLIGHDRTIQLDRTTPRHERFAWIYEGDLLIEEIEEIEEGAALSSLHQRHAHDARGHRIQTEYWLGAAEPDDPDAIPQGIWTFDLDEQGHPTGGVFDLDGDGEPEGIREEHWSKQVFGWRVERAEIVPGLPTLLLVQELDELERVLWSSEDWDGDGYADRTEQRAYLSGAPPERERLTQWEIAGSGVVDLSCSYVYDGLDRIGSLCEDELHFGSLETSYTFEAPERVSSGTTWYHDDGESELWEHYAYTWEGCL